MGSKRIELSFISDPHEIQNRIKALNKAKTYCKFNKKQTEIVDRLISDYKKLIKDLNKFDEILFGI